MPVVTLKMGSSLNPDDIKEGDDVYFECHIRSNPKPYKMAWYHDVCMIFFSPSKFLSLIHSFTLLYLFYHFPSFNADEVFMNFM